MTVIEDIYIEFDDIDPAIVDVPDDEAFEVVIIQGADGRSMQPVGQVPTYADLPTLGPAEAEQVWLAGGLAYIWDGEAWPAEEDGVAFQGPKGDDGRGVQSIAVSGSNLVFTMTETPTTETVAVPAITAAAASATAAAGSAASAANAKTAAEAARDTATTAATNAGAANTAAQSAKTAAESARDTAVTKAGEASASATAADASKTAAAGSATAAAGSASSAGTSATDASNANTAAQTAKTDAQSARDAAQTAATAAAASETNAAASEGAAIDAAADAAISSAVAASASTTATGAAAAATSARDDAQTAGAAAKASAEAAAESEGNAAASETNAGNAATNASGSAAAASTSETNAATSAGSASDSADLAEYWAEQAAEAVGSGIPNATTSTKGGVQLSNVAGEVGGTFDHLVVNGWASKADLVGGKIPSSQLPSIATTETFVVADTAARLALTCETGDVAIQTDNPGRGTYILQGSNPATSGHWALLATPDAAVASVNGYTGAVVLAKGDVGLGAVDNTSDVNKPVSTAAQTALDGKTTTARTISAGTGLTGGGDLTANRTLALSAASQTSLGKADSAVQPARTVSAGTGLTGGGDLSADRTLSLSAATQASLGKADSAIQQAALDSAIGNAQLVAINAQSGTAYTLDLSDQNKAVECVNASAITVTVPPNSAKAFPIGSVIEVVQTGAGQVTLAAAGGVTLNSPGAMLKSRAQWSTIVIRKRATDTWIVAGDVAA